MQFNSTRRSVWWSTVRNVTHPYSMVRRRGAECPRVDGEGDHSGNARIHFFVVLSHQRSGTRLLTSLVSKDDEVKLYHELWARGKRKPYEINDFYWEKRRSKPILFADHVAAINGKRGFRAVGSIVQAWQIPGDLLDRHFLLNGSVAKILLIRPNFAHVYLSRLQRLYVRHMQKGETPRGMVGIDEGRFKREAIRWKRWYEHVIRRIMEAGQDAMTIAYEALMFQSHTMLRYHIYSLKRHIGIPNPTVNIDIASLHQLQTGKETKACLYDNVSGVSTIPSLTKNSELAELPFLSYCPF